MNPHDIPLLSSRQDLEALRHAAGHEPVVGIWATTIGIDNTALMLMLREALQRRGLCTLFFLTSRETLPQSIRRLPPERRRDCFRVESPQIFAESHTPDLLIANTLTLNVKPADFQGKTLLLPHSALENLPNRISYWADYIATPSRCFERFDYDALPNRYKYGAGRTLTIIPAGYAKNDLLCAAAAHMPPGPYRRVSFFPHWRLPEGMRPEALGRLWLELIERFFAAFPGWEFVLRPLEHLRESPQVRMVRQHFQGSGARLRIEIGKDGTDSLLRSDVLLTDYSNVWRNYSFTTLRPAVLFQPDADADAVRREACCLVAATPEAAVQALREALTDNADRRRAIRALRDRESLHFGRVIPYLCDAVERILRDEPPAPDWIVIDKGDTPYARCRDWLRLLRRRFGSWHAFTVPTVQQWHDSIRGPDSRVCLAILRAGLRSWEDYERPIARDSLTVYLQHALAGMPAAWSVAFLQHCRRRRPQDQLVALWAAHALQRCQGDHPALAEALREAVRHCQAVGVPASPLLANILNFSDLRPDDQPPGESDPPLLRAVAAIMRLQRGQVEQGAAILRGMAGPTHAEKGTPPARAALAIGRSLLRHADRRLPHAGMYRALHLPVMGLWLSFSSGAEARAMLADALPPFWEMACQDPRLLMPCAHLAALVGDERRRALAFAAARQRTVSLRDLIVMDDILRAVARDSDAPARSGEGQASFPAAGSEGRGAGQPD